jgi:hypothetical protein
MRTKFWSVVMGQEGKPGKTGRDSRADERNRQKVCDPRPDNAGFHDHHHNTHRDHDRNVSHPHNEHDAEHRDATSNAGDSVCRPNPERQREFVRQALEYSTFTTRFVLMQSEVLRRANSRLRQAPCTISFTKETCRQLGDFFDEGALVINDPDMRAVCAAPRHVRLQQLQKNLGQNVASEGLDNNGAPGWHLG